jgi:hypothetical protein
VVCGFVVLWFCGFVVLCYGDVVMSGFVYDAVCRMAYAGWVQ